MLWFKKWGWIHRPASIIGWVLALLVILLIVWVFVVVDRYSHSASDTLIGVFPWAWIFLGNLKLGRIENEFKMILTTVFSAAS